MRYIGAPDGLVQQTQMLPPDDSGARWLDIALKDAQKPTEFALNIALRSKSVAHAHNYIDVDGALVKVTSSGVDIQDTLFWHGTSAAAAWLVLADGGVLSPSADQTIYCCRTKDEVVRQHVYAEGYVFYFKAEAIVASKKTAKNLGRCVPGVVLHDPYSRTADEWHVHPDSVRMCGLHMRMDCFEAVVAEWRRSRLEEAKAASSTHRERARQRMFPRFGTSSHVPADAGELAKIKKHAQKHER